MSGLVQIYNATFRNFCPLTDIPSTATFIIIIIIKNDDV